MIFNRQDGKITIGDGDIESASEALKDYVMATYGEYAIDLVGECDMIHNLDPNGCSYEQFSTKPFEGPEDDNYGIMQDYWDTIIQRMYVGLLAQMISKAVTVDISELT